MRRPSPATAIATLALVISVSGTAYAATGGTFILGRSNSAGQVTGLANPNGPALSLSSKAGTPPLNVSNGVQVPNLNASRVGGLAAPDLVTMAVADTEARISPAYVTTVPRPWGGYESDGTTPKLQVRIQKSTARSCFAVAWQVSNFVTGGPGPVGYSLRWAGPDTGGSVSTFFYFNAANQHELWAGARTVAVDGPPGTYAISLDAAPGTGGMGLAADSNDSGSLMVQEVSRCAPEPD